MADNDTFGPAEDGAPDWAQGFGAGPAADSSSQASPSEGHTGPGTPEHSRGADPPEHSRGADASSDDAAPPPQKRRWRRERERRSADPAGAAGLDEEAVEEEPDAAAPPPPPPRRRSRLGGTGAAAAETDTAGEDPEPAEPDKAPAKKRRRLPQLQLKRAKGASAAAKGETGDEPSEPEYKLPRGKWKIAIWDGRSVITVRGKGHQISSPPVEQAYENSETALAAALKTRPRLVVAASQPLEQASSAETRFADSDRPDAEMPKRGRRLREAAHLIDVFGKGSAVITFGAVSAILPEVTKREHGKAKFTLAACSVGHEDGVHIYLGLETTTLVLTAQQRVIEYGQIDTGLNSSEKTPQTGTEATHGARNALAYIAETVGEETQRFVSTWSARHGLIRAAYLTGPGAQQWQTIAASIQSAAGLTARASAPQLEVEVDAWLPVAAVAGYGLNAPRFWFPHRLPRRQTIRKHSLRAAFVVGVLALMFTMRSRSQSEGQRIADEVAAIEQQAAEVTAFTATIETPEEAANRELAAEAAAAEQVATRWLLDGSYEPAEYPIWERALTEIGGGNTLTRQQIRLPSLRSPERDWGNSRRWQPIPLRWSMGVLGERFTLSAGATEASSDSDSGPVDWPSSRQEVPTSRWDQDAGAFE